MKARVKATGEIINLADYCRITFDKCDSYGNPIELSPEEVEIINEPTDKEQKEMDHRIVVYDSDMPSEQRMLYELSKTALQGIISSNYCVEKEFTVEGNLSRYFQSPSTIAGQCVTLAKEIVKKLKESEEQK